MVQYLEEVRGLCEPPANSSAFFLLPAGVSSNGTAREAPFTPGQKALGPHLNKAGYF